MRSEYVFAATREIGNRFLLCRVAAASARRLHRGSTQPSETINRSLKLIATGESGDHEKAASPRDSLPLAETASAGSS